MLRLCYAPSQHSLRLTVPPVSAARSHASLNCWMCLFPGWSCSSASSSHDTCRQHTAEQQHACLSRAHLHQRNCCHCLTHGGSLVTTTCTFNSLLGWSTLNPTLKHHLPYEVMYIAHVPPSAKHAVHGLLAQGQDSHTALASIVATAQHLTCTATLNDLPHSCVMARSSGPLGRDTAKYTYSNRYLLMRAAGSCSSSSHNASSC